MNWSKLALRGSIGRGTRVAKAFSASPWGLVVVYTVGGCVTRWWTQGGRKENARDYLFTIILVDGAVFLLVGVKSWQGDFVTGGLRKSKTSDRS